jgi:hypothetical protein
VDWWIAHTYPTPFATLPPDFKLKDEVVVPDLRTMTAGFADMTILQPVF